MVVFIVALSAIDALTRGAVSLPALVPPFGASVVIVFFAPDSPAARPWNVMIGQTVSALVACSVLALLPGRQRLNLHAFYGEFGGKRVDDLL